MLEFALEYVDCFGVMVMLGVFYGAMLRGRVDHRLRDVLMGFLLGAAAVFSMLHPLPIGDGVFVDPRNLFIGFSGAFFGAVPLVITLVTSVSVRIVLGGKGIYAGTASMLIAASAGIIWSSYARKSEGKEISTYQLLVLGLMLSAELLGLFLLPRQLFGMVFTRIAPVIFVMDIVNAIVMGRFFIRERRLALLEQQLRREALFDPLTGLLNRRGFSDSLVDLGERFRSKGLIVIVVDLDHFKSVNDRFGHDSGDKVLVSAAVTIREHFAKDAILARSGGEEFLLLFPETDRAQGPHLAETVRAAIANMALMQHDMREHITASIGGAWAARLDDVPGAISRADLAMYEAKRAGRNRWRFAD